MTKKRMLFIVCPVLIALTVAIVLIISVRNTKSVPEIGKAATFFWDYEDITESVAEPIDTKGMEIEEHL